MCKNTYSFHFSVASLHIRGVDTESDRHIHGRKEQGASMEENKGKYSSTCGFGLNKIDCIHISVQTEKPDRIR